MGRSRNTPEQTRQARERKRKRYKTYHARRKVAGFKRPPFTPKQIERRREYQRGVQSLLRATPEGRAFLRDQGRRQRAKDGGYAPPPAEGDCPPRPADGCCDCCLKPVTNFHLDHDHITGAFRGWVCSPCNLAAFPDNPELLIRRADFLTGNLPWL